MCRERLRQKQRHAKTVGYPDVSRRKRWATDVRLQLRQSFGDQIRPGQINFRVIEESKNVLVTRRGKFPQGVRQQPIAARYQGFHNSRTPMPYIP